MRCSSHKADSQTRVLITTAPGNNPYIAMLSRALQNEGLVTFFPSNSGILPLLKVNQTSGPFDLIHLQWIDGFLLGREGPRRVKSLLKTIRFHTQFAWLTARHTPVVWTIHNLTNHEKIHTSWELLNYRLLARVAKRLIVHCESAAPLVAKAYQVPQHKIRTVPLGDYGEWYTAQGLPSETRDAARVALHLPQHAHILLIFGLLRMYKGVLELVQAFAQLPGDHLRLVIAGYGKEPALRAILHDLASQDPRVILDYRYVEDALLLHYISACDAVVLPYRDVLTSSAVNLAASQGRCPIVPCLGCMQEFCDGAAIAYDPADPNGLASALIAAEALGQPGLDELGRQAQARVRAFPWKRVAQQTLQVYNECLSEREA